MSDEKYFIEGFMMAAVAVSGFFAKTSYSQNKNIKELSEKLQKHITYAAGHYVGRAELAALIKELRSDLKDDFSQVSSQLIRIEDKLDNKADKSR